MLPARPVEVDHVGRALAEHRDRLMVEFGELVLAADAPMNQMLARIEKSRALTVDHIEIHHTALMKAWADVVARASVPVAIREQWYTAPEDWSLWHRAMKLRPSVVWWWGVRTEPEARGAWCYVCDAQIHRYDVGRGLTKRARLMVMTHRYGHVIALETTAPEQTKESYL